MYSVPCFYILSSLLLLFTCKMTSPDLDSVVRVLQTYPGRDKAIRSLAFWLQLRAQTSDQKDAILALAKQLSSARLVLRQLNHPAMIKACKHLLHHKPTDHVSFFVLFQFLLHFIFDLLFTLFITNLFSWIMLAMLPSLEFIPSTESWNSSPG